MFIKFHTAVKITRILDKKILHNNKTYFPQNKETTCTYILCYYSTLLTIVLSHTKSTYKYKGRNFLKKKDKPNVHSYMYNS